MNNRFYNDNIEKIANHYGIDSQMNILQEECAELIQAVSKYRRGDPSTILEEVADVHIMLDQVVYLLGNATIPRIVINESLNYVIENKIKRQLKRIEEESDD